MPLPHPHPRARGRKPRRARGARRQMRAAAALLELETRDHRSATLLQHAPPPTHPSGPETRNCEPVPQ